jgi:hypothetical protein
MGNVELHVFSILEDAFAFAVDGHSDRVRGRVFQCLQFCRRDRVIVTKALDDG